MQSPFRDMSVEYWFTFATSWATDRHFLLERFSGDAPAPTAAWLAAHPAAFDFAACAGEAINKRQASASAPDHGGGGHKRPRVEHTGSVEASDAHDRHREHERERDHRHREQDREHRHREHERDRHHDREYRHRERGREYDRDRQRDQGRQALDREQSRNFEAGLLGEDAMATGASGTLQSGASGTISRRAPVR